MRCLQSTKNPRCAAGPHASSDAFAESFVFMRPIGFAEPGGGNYPRLLTAAIDYQHETSPARGDFMGLHARNAAARPALLLCVRKPSAPLVLATRPTPRLERPAALPPAILRGDSGARAWFKHPFSKRLSFTPIGPLHGVSSPSTYNPPEQKPRGRQAPFKEEPCCLMTNFGSPRERIPATCC